MIVIFFLEKKSNACGQLGQSYQDYRCPAHEKHMECEVDPTMEITAVTHATWYGAPGTFVTDKNVYARTVYRWIFNKSRIYLTNNT